MSQSETNLAQRVHLVHVCGYATRNFVGLFIEEKLAMGVKDVTNPGRTNSANGTKRKRSEEKA